MMTQVVEQLVAREQALIAALDEQDLAKIERATSGIREAVTRLTATGGWRAEPELKERLVHALKLAQAASGRLNYLADRNRRQLDRLATLTGAPLPAAYGRSGRLG